VQKRKGPGLSALHELIGITGAWLFNRRHRGRLARIDSAARQLHRRLLIADLHADTLLWNRDLLRRSRAGHVDLPRLVEGGVALQVFSVVTNVPQGQNIECNEDTGDRIPLLARLQGWPEQTWHSAFERARYQAQRLETFARRSDGALTVIRNQRDLAALIAAREKSLPTVGGILSLEGAQALEGRLDNLPRLLDLGFRLIGPAHFTDTAIAGSAHGSHKGGLTALGREWLTAMDRHSMLVDLAHSSPRTIDDVLALTSRPVIASHTGVKGTCNNARNLSDEHLRGIAATGGVIGIGFWPEAIGRNGLSSLIEAINHAVSVTGPEHVALGSDFDGAVTTVIDAAQLPVVTQALLDAGYTDADIGKIMGGNFIRLLSRTLPA
jgi:membrane dipeptidase